MYIITIGNLHITVKQANYIKLFFIHYICSDPHLLCIICILQISLMHVFIFFLKNGAKNDIYINIFIVLILDVNSEIEVRNACEKISVI